MSRMPKFSNRRTVDVIIANVDDLYSLVYITDTKELFSITIEPGTMENSLTNVNYLFGQIYISASLDEIAPKLYQFGVRRRIRMHSGDHPQFRRHNSQIRGHAAPSAARRG